MPYYNKLTFIMGLLYIMVLFSCKESRDRSAEQPNTPILIKSLSAEGKDMEEPYLLTSKDGKNYLSWIQREGQNNQLKYAYFDSGNNWESEKTIASGDDWFVNWADYPQMAIFDDGTLVATYLQKSGPGTFSYDIKVTFSHDGVAWSEPITLHDDHTLTEHGFVSMTPWEENMLITWLDGRNTASAQGGNHHGHHHHGQMTARAAVFASDGTKINEWQLDDRVCDCCQTASAMTANGPAVIFRDRSENEIRDLGLVRWENDQWTDTTPIHMDWWEIAACPVNGPRIAARGETVAVVWYTAAKDLPIVQISFSENNGLTFGAATRIDLGKTLGRVSIVLTDENTAWVSWMEESSIYARRITKDGLMDQPIVVTQTSGKRSSGFPQMVYSNGRLVWAWTDDSGPHKSIQIAEMKL